MAVLLIAEDDDDVRMLLKRIFSRAGFTVHVASEGASALRLARTTRPDVVLTDLDMPTMNGLELCRAIRLDPVLAGTPVAVLSGGLRPGDARVAGANLCEVLLKPFVNADLVAAVRRLADAGPHDHPGVGTCATPR